MGIKKGDIVQVVSGKEKGKTGKVLNILNKKNRVIVEKLNLIKKHQKPDNKGKGGVVEKEGSIHLSNVVVFCSKCNSGVRVGYKVLEDGDKVRYCKKCSETMDS